MQTLAEIIKEYRSEHNLSLREFSNLCGVSHTYIDKIEKTETQGMVKLLNLL
ncbi:helix-turn-helix transcriptional regulator [Clostridioides difficile]|uniref:helix-turn-helix domain-containing protein n=1 Tax=Clostridioides difficile TaxID=1496 RepID=UPI001AF6138A|nr:helix-turn-helix transcriptional regulator [Clostridioides difficile]QQY53381.1 helix-turn-helix transcriptional regulator [Clostridioides difficile]QQY53431.1 helix-turn-helix transcriptional regulator [Clostridioides difficile]